MRARTAIGAAIVHRSAAFIRAEWPAPPRVRALTTVRSGGVSLPPFASFNLADHVGDDPVAVARNRELLRESLNLPAEPAWLVQVHGTSVVDAARAAPGTRADGSFAERAGIVCAVLTADCLPIFLCDDSGGRAGILHAGWRGLAAGIAERGVDAMAMPPATLMAWLGPAIGPDAFEVGAEVRAEFVAGDAAAAAMFIPNGNGRFLADLYGLARLRLRAAGVDRIYGGGLCTVADQNRFFSYRRDGQCGRMASLIWLER